MMRKIFMGLFLGLFTLSAKAVPLAQWQTATVKVSSFPCLMARPRFSGSGLLLSYQGSVWVLTSEHVVIQDKSSFTCHEVESDIGKSKSELVVADYQMGLALLKVHSPSESLSRSAVSIVDLQRDSLDSPVRTLVALGFPSGSHQLQTLTNGRLLTSESKRALIAKVPTMIEAADLPVEYGMSGGILVGAESEGGEFLGFLSHQVLRREAGKPSDAKEINPEDTGNRNDLALAIPGKMAISWFFDQVRKPGALVWQRDPEAQKNSQEVVQYGPLLFTLKQTNANDIWDIGGADGSGIGGGDGSGIGGDDQSRTPASEDLLSVEISLNPAADPALKSNELHDPTLNLWRNWLLNGRKVEVAFLKNPQARRLLKIGSMAQFFTYWMRDAYVPLAVRSKVGDMHSDGEKLVRLSSVAAGIAQEARDQSTIVDRKAWFSMLRDYVLMAANGLCSSQDILETLQGESDVYWRIFYDEDFDTALSLETSIQNLIEQMKKMGL